MPAKPSKGNNNLPINPWLAVLLFLILVALYWYLERPAIQTSLIITGDLPAYNDMLPVGPQGDQVIHHKGYSLAYDEETEQAEWVIYLLTDKYVMFGTEERTDNFREDAAVLTGSATMKDYNQSGYDRGHLAPAGDMKWDYTAMSESFYFSNMSPQLPAFNRGVWKNLEEQVREWAKIDGELMIVTGPIFKGERKLIGPSEVEVPDYYYKIVFDVSKPEIKAIGFILAHKRSKESLSSFAVTVDSVERFTGIDFFPGLADSIENVIEADLNLNLWHFSNGR